MPHPSQTDRETTIRTARTLIEAEGVDALSLAKLAAALNIKAPSLYHHFANKTALLRAVNEQTETMLVDAMRSAIHSEDDAPATLRTIFRVYRAFAQDNPNLYSLLYMTTQPELRGSPEAAARLAQPLQVVMAGIVGDGRALAALRAAWAFLHGFVMLELAEQFKRGGDLDADFASATEIFIRGLVDGDAR